MAQPKDPIENLLLSAAALIFLPLLPLGCEFLVKSLFHSDSSIWLDPDAIMLTAPIFAVGVGLASRFQAIFAYLALLSILFAVLYGGQVGQKQDPQGAPSAKAQAAVASETGGSVDPKASSQARIPSPVPTFWSRMGLTYPPAILAWLGILFSTILFVAERYFRHIMLREPFEFEWEK